ncbi:MAG: hypothetical protein U9Q16_02825 [Patescibacteria group bacterium]|nr:hypothetical protein [Patescibacteria group bacterium]
MTDKYTHSFADNIRLAKSKVLKGAVTAATYNLIRLPKFAFVTDVWALVSTACSATDVTVGWSGNGETAQTAGFISDTIMDAGVTGLKRAQHDTLVAFEGKYFNGGSGALTITLGTTWSAGEVIILCQYHVIH